MNDTHLYPYSVKEAKKRGELTLWRESYRANISCKAAIEQAIRRNFDGMHLKPDCIKEVLADFGYKRTAFVLANTLQELSHDGRFSPANKAWSKGVYVPPDKEHNPTFVVTSHPAVLDGFVDLYQKEYQALGLFNGQHCEPNSYSQLDYEGKVLVLSADTLAENWLTPQAQLWLAHDGFGCHPGAIGRSVRCTCLGDGETTRWNRRDFVGVLKPEFLPDWAEQKLAELNGQQQTNALTMSGMTMK